MPPLDSRSKAAPRLLVPYAAVLVLLLPARDAHAYLDPASGSLILQLVVGGAMGALYFVRRHWRSLRARVAGETAPARTAKDASADPAAR